MLEDNIYSSMDFKEWFLIREMASKPILDDIGSSPMIVQTSVGPIDGIDFRFEDYPKDTQAEITLITKLTKDQIKSPPYYGKMPEDVLGPNNKYAYYNGDYLTLVSDEPQGIKLPDHDRFGHNWWWYAEASYDNKVMKKPGRPRPEQGFRPEDIDKPFFRH